MRRVLVLGGTAWLGREVARTARDAGAHVVCVARGTAGAAPEGVELITADRRDPAAYDRLGGEWDEVIELSYAPELVRPALAALAERAAHWTLVSSVSVYASNAQIGEDETGAVVEPRDLTQYPDAKVAAERATRSRVADRLLIARPGLIVGAGDPSDRFGYWAARLLCGGTVLRPSPEDRWAQLISVTDLANWVVHAGAQQTVETVNAVGEPVPFTEFFAAAARATGFTGDWVNAEDAELLAAGLEYWAGPRSLPLWLPREESGFARRDGRAYVRTGAWFSRWLTPSPR